MPDTFVLRIELGNDAMQTPADIAAALRKLANDLERGFSTRYGTLRDVNGNTVGSWEVQ